MASFSPTPPDAPVMRNTCEIEGLESPGVLLRIGIELLCRIDRGGLSQ